MMLFRVQCGANFLIDQVIFPLHFLETHASGQTADDDGHWGTRATKHP